MYSHESSVLRVTPSLLVNLIGSMSPSYYDSLVERARAAWSQRKQNFSMQMARHIMTCQNPMTYCDEELVRTGYKPSKELVEELMLPGCKAWQSFCFFLYSQECYNKHKHPGNNPFVMCNVIEDTKEDLNNIGLSSPFLLACKQEQKTKRQAALNQKKMAALGFSTSVSVT